MKREYKKSLGCQIHISSSDDSGDIYFFTFANALKKNDRTTVPLNSVKIYINKEKFIKCKLFDVFVYFCIIFVNLATASFHYIWSYF